MSRPALPITPVERAILVSTLGHREAARALSALHEDDASVRQWNHSAVIYHRDKLTRADPLTIVPTLNQHEAWVAAAGREGIELVEWLSHVADEATGRWVLSAGDRQRWMRVHSVYRSEEEASAALKACEDTYKVVTYLGPRDGWRSRHLFYVGEGQDTLPIGVLPEPGWSVQDSAPELWGQ